MNVIQFCRTHQPDGPQYERFNTFDFDRFDYTLFVQTPAGETITLRNPAEKDGVLSDKRHTIGAGCKLIAAGTAGWEWGAKLQHFIGIDIDTNDTHEKGLSPGALQPILEASAKLPWAEVRRSSGGSGLHIFVRFTEPVESATRADGSALAKAVLVLMSREADFDFKAVKDCAGGNMWIYKDGAPANAYEIVKPATETLDAHRLPPGWREVKKAKSRPVDFSPSTVTLEPEHLKVEKHLQDFAATTIYVPEVGCYHVHTHALQEVARLYSYRGFFATSSPGTDLGKPNAYMFPIPGGGFLVKRFGDAHEHSSWYEGPNGQYALLDVEASFEKAVAHFGMNSTSKGYAFSRTNLVAMLQATGATLSVPEGFEGRTLFVKAVKDKVRLSVEKHDNDGPIEDWTSTDKTWQRSYTMPMTPPAFGEAAAIRGSAVVRAVTTDTESTKWVVKTDGAWIGTNASEVSKVLESIGAWPAGTMGRMRLKPYWLVFEPYRPEYLSHRRWNREAPQLAVQPADVAGDTPTWDAIFEHVGSGLDGDVRADQICQAVGIVSGDHYLRLWVKLLIEHPAQRTPYLFLTSRQNNTGKTSLGAALCHLIDAGVAEINEEAFVDKFTGELEGKVLCLIEELDLRGRGNKAYATLKRVLTSKTLTIRRMRTDAYNVPNYTHFIHTANDAHFVPCECEDMRIVMIDVPPIKNLIESDAFEAGVRSEAPSMLRKLLDMPMVERRGRFWLPVVQTSLKEDVLAGTYDDGLSEAEVGLRQFAEDCLVKCSAGMAPVPEVLAKYDEYCSAHGTPRVARPAFMKTLKEKCQFAVGKRQKRVDERRVWHYTGVELKC
jgi:hypothetical protein